MSYLNLGMESRASGLTHDPRQRSSAQTKYQGTNCAVEQIRRTDPTSASRILGVHISPVGDFLSQIQVLKKKSEPFALLSRRN
jgi:hypothetical protein